MPDKSKPHCKLLGAEDIDAFNREVKKAGKADLADSDLRGLDLRGADLRNADLRGAYLRNADLRGLDLSGASLEGASINQALVSGTLFPKSVSAQEILLSLEHGTRIRTS